MGHQNSIPVLPFLSREKVWERWELHIMNKYGIVRKGAKLIHELESGHDGIVYEEVIEKNAGGTPKLYMLRTMNLGTRTQLCQIINKHLKQKKTTQTLNLLEAERFHEGSLCSGGTVILALFEHSGTYSLDQLMHYKKHQSQEKKFTFQELLNIYKFLIDCFQDLKQINSRWYPTISLADIVVPQEKGTFKYRNLCEVIYFEEPEMDKYYHSPENWATCQREHEYVFSFGMCMINLCLLGGIQACYDYRNMIICVSILQQKIEALRKLNSTEAWASFCELLEAMTQIDFAKRPTIDECSSLSHQVMQLIKSEEKEKTQNLSDISTSCNPPVITRSTNKKAYRRLHIHNIPLQKNSGRFSGSKAAKDGSHKKKQKSNKKQKLPEWKIDMSDKQNGMILERIDQKWKQDQIFQKMPAFNEEKSFQLHLDTKIFEQIEIKKNSNDTLKSERK